MPSASAKLEKQMSTETYDPMKQIVTIVEKKVRNLEKRKGKLDSYRLDSQNGKELNEDQKKAVEKYDQVVELLDFAKDLQKQFQGVVQEMTKAQKKAIKRDQLERQQQELQRIKEIMVYQDLLNSMGGEDVRQDFLDGNKGAVKLSEEELNSLDELYKAICPERDPESENSDFDGMLSTSAEHIQALLDAKNKEAFGTTYKALRETLLKINSCTYFNKSDEAAQNETESNASLPEEQDDGKCFPEQETEPIACSEVDDFVMVQKSEDYGTVPQVERPYYQMESSSLYVAEQAPQPIQEVLSGQGNLNFLQESQIEVGASHPDPQAPATLPGVSYANVQYPTAPQPHIAAQHLTRRPSEEAMSNHSTAANLLANSASIQQANIPPNVVTQPADFDPGRPIPTQTYTNQSFSSVVHPMMVTTQNYASATLPHTISPAHVLPANMVVQPLPPRSVVTSANALPMTAAHALVSGLSTASALSPQPNMFSLCLKMNQMNIESSQTAAHVQTLQYDSNEIQETPYQSTNNNQAYMTRDNFGDNSSYSSNLKRGLTSRGGARGASAPRGSNMARGGRVGYRN